MIYTIKNRKIVLSINSFGAQLINVTFKGKEKLWQNSDGSWEDHAPVIFPICGKCQMVVDGKIYPLEPHGFAMKSNFTLVRHTKKYIELKIVSNVETKKVYPFDFVFKVIYKLVNNKVIVKYIVNNLSKNDMYFSCGAHDSFVVEEPLENYYIRFNKDEKLIGYYDDNGILTNKSISFIDKREFKIDGSGLKDDYSLIFKNINSNRVWLLDKNKEKVVEVGFEGFKNFVFWRSLNNDMICIEPWLNLPDEENQKPIEFKNKIGIKTVKSNQTCKLKRYIKYYD